MARVNREAISKKLRFEVFKRDSFKCQYCGRSAPDVILNADHIKPVKENGKTTIMNLVTSCNECNLGKGAILLNDNSVLEKQRKQLEELNERREQLEMMMKWREGLMRLDRDKYNYVLKKIIQMNGGYGLTDSGQRKLLICLKKYDLNLTLDAIESSYSQYIEFDKDGNSTKESREKAFLYISRICACQETFKKKPYLKDLYYIRGILKNRLSYLNPQTALQMMEKCYLKNASIQSLKDLALCVKNWSEFRNAVEKYLEGDK